MKNLELEKKLKKAVEKVTPDKLEDILSKCEERGGFDMNTVKVNNEIRKSKIFIPKLASVMVVLIIGVIGVTGYARYDSYYKVDSIVEFDVNPSIEMQVSKKDRVINVIPLNDDGRKVIDNMDFKNVDVNMAVNALVGSMLKYGYLSDMSNSILVSVKNDNVQKGKILQEQITQKIDEVLKVSSINGAILTQVYDNKTTDNTVKEIETENKVSEGKANLINKILNSGIKDHDGNLFTASALSALTINELNLLLEEKNTKLENVVTTGNSSEKSYITRENAKEIAFASVGVLASNAKRVEIELDYDNGKMVYEIEFQVGKNEYEFEIDAKTGVILESKVDRDDDDFDDKWDRDDRYDD